MASANQKDPKGAAKPKAPAQAAAKPKAAPDAKPSARLNVAGHQQRDCFLNNPDVLPEWPLESLTAPPSRRRRSRVTHIFFLLDRSGSMSSIQTETIEGFNSFISRAKTSGEKAAVTLALFDDEFDVVTERVTIDKFELINDRRYVPRGMTPLLDAMARTIVLADRAVVGDLVNAEDVLIVAMTDGGENASHHMTNHALARVIADREGLGYEFLYLGANQDSFAEAAQMGVRHAGDWEANERGTRLNLARSERLMRAKMAGTRLDSMTIEQMAITDEDAQLVDEDSKDASR